jgi:hypothetical protein
VLGGIHPDLTGRENVQIYGSLLGLKRSAVAARFDEIVAFAELESAIDRQVKFYSWGMRLRLGFSVAAFLQPKVLLVDEVLAVGDASFQQKCLDRIHDVVAEGTTMVFVSHDLAAVESTCRRALWLQDGVVVADGPVREVLARYRQSVGSHAVALAHADGPIQFVSAVAKSPDRDTIRTDGALEISVEMESAIATEGFFAVGVSEGPATAIFILSRELTLRPGFTEVRCRIPHLPLAAGRYSVWATLIERDGVTVAVPWQSVGSIDVFGPTLDAPPMGVVRLSPVHVEAAWQVEEIGTETQRAVEL